MFLVLSLKLANVFAYGRFTVADRFKRLRPFSLSEDITRIVYAQAYLRVLDARCPIVDAVGIVCGDPYERAVWHYEFAVDVHETRLADLILEIERHGVAFAHYAHIRTVVSRKQRVEYALCRDAAALQPLTDKPAAFCMPDSELYRPSPKSRSTAICFSLFLAIKLSPRKMRYTTDYRSHVEIKRSKYSIAVLSCFPPNICLPFFTVLNTTVRSSQSLRREYASAAFSE